MGVNLQVNLELLDMGISSATGAQEFASCSIFLDPADYDGATYYFEVVATNAHASNSYSFYLRYETTDIATCTVPANTTTPTRIRSSSFTPQTGKTQYSFRVQATASNDQMIAYAARIVVVQVNATKTRIQIPMSNAQADNFNRSLIVGAISSTATTYGSDSILATLYLKDSAVFGDLIATNPWTFEATLRINNAGQTASMQLWNVTDGTQVTAARITHTGNTIFTLKDVDFSNSATNFHDGDIFRVDLITSASNQVARVGRSALYVRLENLNKAEVYHRVGRYRPNGTGASDIVHHRILYENFDNPTIYLDGSGYCVDNTDRAFIWDGGTNDSGTGGSKVTPGVNFNSASRTYVRSSAVSMTDGNRYWCRVDASTNQLLLTSLIVVYELASGATTHEVSFSLSKGVAVSKIGNLDIPESVSLARIGEVTSLAGKIIEENVSVGKSMSISDGVNLDVPGSVALSKSNSIVTLTSLQIESVLSVVKSLMISPTVEGEIFVSTSIGRILSVLTSSGLSLEAPLAISVSFGIESIGELVQGGTNYDENVILELTRNVSALSSLDIPASLTISRHLTISEEGGIILEGSITLPNTRMITSSAVPVLSVSVSLDRFLSLSEESSFSYETSLVLSEILMLLSDGTITTDASLSLAKTLAESVISTITQDGAISLSQSLDVLSSSSFLLSGELDLNKILDISAQTNIEVRTEITLGTIKTVVSSGGMTLNDAILLAAEYAITLVETSYSFGVTPQARIIIIFAENRILDIRFEDRQFRIHRETRDIPVLEEDRIISILEENRVISVPYNITETTMTEMLKPPDAVKDYKFDWKAKTNGSGSSDWLQDTETIVSFDVIVPPDLVLEASSLTDGNTSVTAWISGGMDGREYEVSCKIETSEGRVEVATVMFKVATKYV